jgi:hypothetical protein
MANGFPLWCPECGTRLDPDIEDKSKVGDKMATTLRCENPRCHIGWTFIRDVHGLLYCILQTHDLQGSGRT